MKFVKVLGRREKKKSPWGKNCTKLASSLDYYLFILPIYLFNYFHKLIHKVREPNRALKEEERRKLLSLLDFQKSSLSLDLEARVIFMKVGWFNGNLGSCSINEKMTLKRCTS